MNTPPLFHGPNAGYVLDMYEQYCADPSSVDAATRQFLEAWIAQASPPPAPPAPQPAPNGAHASAATAAPAPASAPPVAAPASNGASLPAAPAAPVHDSAPAAAATNGSQPTQPSPVASDADAHAFAIPDIVSAARLVRLIRTYGHMEARIDPLGRPYTPDPGLRMDTYNLTRDLLKAMPAITVRNFESPNARNAYEAIEELREIYCGSVGYDFHHVQDYNERFWLREAAESNEYLQMIDDDTDLQREVLRRLTETETFERFLHQTFPGQKRFSLEGNDILIPMLDAVIQEATRADTQEVVIGMAHRGRLNVLAHILGKPYSAILAEFQGPNHYNKATYQGWTGDVKYHLGARKAYQEGGMFEMPVTLVPNPSHLEFVNPVVMGRARAAQERRDSTGLPERDVKASLPLLIHGDASFPGQGIVAETLNLSRLLGYRTGGTIHIIINNQIGFTTNSNDARSTHYASDLAKGFEIPVIHVNADDPRACIAVMKLAWAYREHFARDILIDLIGYRRWGHNEGDEPSFTQPGMYDLIANHPTARELWAAHLIEQGVLSQETAQGMVRSVQNRLQRAQKEVEKRGRIEATVAVPVSALVHHPVESPPVLTADYITELNEALLARPEGFQVHQRLDQRIFQNWRAALQEPNRIEWAHAETLAFAAILAAGTPVRLTGQDSERGTFSQRHLVLHNQSNGERYVPLQQLPQAQASFAVYNSPLSENAAMGFEYGYSIHAPDTLVLWEGQFGDFANGAQVIIDQFLISGWAKWGQQPSLVLLLPHGYEGNGPEHSSGRMERFLQLAADNNIRVVNCTTAAQYFHLLRRQAITLRSDPRPLVVLTPKSLLRHFRAASSLSDLSDGTFERVLPPEPGVADDPQATRLILCSGKVYVDLTTQGKEPRRLPAGVAVARVEELYPFPVQEIEALLRQHPHVTELVWLQEEPQNMGAWSFAALRLRELLARLRPERAIELFYCGRGEAASTAEGTLRQHATEQSQILAEVLAAERDRKPNGHWQHCV